MLRTLFCHIAPTLSQHFLDILLRIWQLTQSPPPSFKSLSCYLCSNSPWGSQHLDCHGKSVISILFHQQPTTWSHYICSSTTITIPSYLTFFPLKMLIKSHCISFHPFTTSTSWAVTLILPVFSSITDTLQNFNFDPIHTILVCSYAL